MPDDLHLMAVAAGAMSRGRLHGSITSTDELPSVTFVTNENKPTTVFPLVNSLATDGFYRQYLGVLF